MCANTISAQPSQLIRKYLNADSLNYLTQDGMVAATGLPRNGFCMACYDGEYPVPYDKKFTKHFNEQRLGRDGVL